MDHQVETEGDSITSCGEGQLGSGLLEDIGNVEMFNRLVNTYVFAQGWPSWAFAVDGLGLQNVSTCVEWINATAREEIKSTHIGNTLISKSLVRSRIDKETSDKLDLPSVFIQGSPFYISKIMSLFRDLRCYCTCVIAGALYGEPAIPEKSLRSVEKLHWRKLSHRSLSGATTGTFWFGSSINLSLHGGISRSNARRTLGHVLRHCTIGESFPHGKVDKQNNMPSLIGSE